MIKYNFLGDYCFYCGGKPSIILHEYLDYCSEVDMWRICKKDRKAHSGYIDHTYIKEISELEYKLLKIKYG